MPDPAAPAPAAPAQPAPAPAEPQAPAPTPASSSLPTRPAPEVVKMANDRTWASALVLANGGTIDSGEKRAVIVCEARTDDGSLAKVTYPTGADFYLRSGEGEESAQFGAEPNVVTMGVNAEQGLLAGFSRTPGILHVGPAHPAYAAANLAYLHGAKDIEIRGLSQHWKDRLQPWFSGLGNHALFPADVKIALT